MNCDKTSVIEDPKFGSVIQVLGVRSKSIAVWNP